MKIFITYLTLPIKQVKRLMIHKVLIHEILIWWIQERDL